MLKYTCIVALIPNQHHPTKAGVKQAQPLKHGGAVLEKTTTSCCLLVDAREWTQGKKSLQ